MNIVQLLTKIAPLLIENLFGQGIPRETASTAVDKAVNDVATEHDQQQDSRLANLERAVAAIAKKIGA